MRRRWVIWSVFFVAWTIGLLVLLTACVSGPIPQRNKTVNTALTGACLVAQLAPYVDIGFDTFLLLERTPLDHETLRLFMQEVAPRLRGDGTGG